MGRAPGAGTRGKALFERLLRLRTDLGLLGEEYDPQAGRLDSDTGPSHRRRAR